MSKRSLRESSKESHTVLLLFLSVSSLPQSLSVSRFDNNAYDIKEKGASKKIQREISLANALVPLRSQAFAALLLRHTRG